MKIAVTMHAPAAVCGGVTGVVRPAHEATAWRPFKMPILAIFVVAVALSSCLEANTLGDEPPDEVQVGSTPAWDNGMEELMTLKCGVCHQVPRPKSAPENTPDELDFTILSGSGDGEVDGAGDALDDIQEIVQEGKMPPDFATPLTDDERAAILDWDGN